MASGDLTDAEWELVGPLLPPERGRPGKPARDNRTVLNGILWRAREGEGQRRDEHADALHVSVSLKL